ncbi:MAG: flagellar motor stator protein MotA [Dissulfurimicrobium sp.]|uniref:flagellar motor stator protein MotA n=1 Tax=Dissulfurimicrobium TaxID=1769732 RepID=UPI001EDAA3F4|nr:flagellar motor stator protein MotA [Dissulfurimicrobium hydrothermale]UKL13649.1 flagellar motor stator protein MotA [Dissulfurimicrobium hydrothermale]
MFVLIGICVVLTAVIGGYLMEHGNLSVLVQPAEVIIIFGAALGSFFIASPMKVVKVVAKGFSSLLTYKGPSKEKYLELLALLYQLFAKSRQHGLLAIESDVEHPEKSPIFSKYPNILANHHALNIICDNLKVVISTNLPAHELESLMDLDIETHHNEAMIPARSIEKIADALPGLGIVAAVLGVVITMGKIDKPPAELGHSIGSALVGTFLGVLMCYGFVGPMSINFEHQAHDDEVYLQIIKWALVSYIGGALPQIAVEFARRAIPDSEKPTFDELEKYVKSRAK